MGNVKSVIENGTLEALTGPVIRNDTGTVKKHIEALEGTDALKIYKSVGERLVEMSEKKNPDRDYSELRKIMSFVNAKKPDPQRAGIRKGIKL